MKKNGILHGEISKTIAELEHYDTILIGDAGMPCQDGVKWIDLAVSEGVPSFFDVLTVVLSELEVQRAIISREMKDHSPMAYARLQGILEDECPIEEIPHEELKQTSKKCKAHIRTGEFTPYCNVILEGGVTF